MGSFARIENRLLPAPETIYWNNGDLRIEEYSLGQKVKYYAKNFIELCGLIPALPVTMAYDWICPPKATPLPQESVNTDPEFNWLPKVRGFASSIFQDTGAGTEFSAIPGFIGVCDWNEHMKDRKNICHTEGFDFKDFFVDTITDPTVYIKMLKDQNVTAHRFSLEWAIIEPAPDKYDEYAIGLYRNFIEKLIEAGITPSITLNHFVLPKWFYEAGSFQKMENIDYYLAYAQKALELFPEVKSWWSFNELGVRAFQQTMEAYPSDLPKGAPLAARIHAVGISTRNTLLAHMKLDQLAREKHPDKEMGVTHQWLQFDAESDNWLERLIGYIFTKITFTPVYNFFKDGEFAFEMPFMANVRLIVADDEFEKNGHFLQNLGVQAYPMPMLKMGLNHGRTYPGMPGGITNLPFFSFGSSCRKGSAVMRFGPGLAPEKVTRILKEAFAIKPGLKVGVTEFGCDGMIQRDGWPDFRLDNEAQAKYIQDFTEHAQQYCESTGHKLSELYCWTAQRRQLEWENGADCKLGILEAIVNTARQLIGWGATPASCYLASMYKDESADTQNTISA